MFKQRLLTTLVLIPLVLLCLYFSSAGFMSGVLSIVIFIMGWEWTSLTPIHHAVLRIGYALLLVALFNAYFLFGSLFPEQLNYLFYSYYYWSMLSFGIWMMIFMAVISYPNSQTIWGYRFVVALLGIILLPLFAISLLMIFILSTHGDKVLYLFALIWSADSGAYLIGKWQGRRKLLPHVSPGKTIEGTVGGMVSALLVALAGYVYFMPAHPFKWFAIALVTVLISILGDLFISILKRRVHIKDTGHVFPGHGGILDRLDSMISAVPFYYFFMH